MMCDSINDITIAWIDCKHILILSCKTENMPDLLCMGAAFLLKFDYPTVLIFTDVALKKKLSAEWLQLTQVSEIGLL